MATPAQTSAPVKKKDLKRSVLLASVGAWALSVLDPIWAYEVNIVFWGAASALMLSVPQLTAAALRRFSDVLDKIEAKLPTGVKGTASWSSSINDISDTLLQTGLFRQGHGAYFGCFKQRGFFGLWRQPILIEQPNVTAVVGSTGSGKGIYHQSINMYSIPNSKFVVDFDGTETVMAAKELRRKGEKVVILNLGDKYANILGESDRFNPLDHIIDCFEIGCITDVWEDVVGLVEKLLPKSKSNNNDNEFFQDGSRDLIAITILITILLYGRNATMGHVLSLLQDRQELLHNCLWFSGGLEQEDGSVSKANLLGLEWAKRHDTQDVLNFADVVGDSARLTADLISSKDSRTYDSFQTGAVQKLINFNKATRSSKKLQKSTFQFSEQLDGDVPVTIFLVLDESKLEAQQDLITLITSIAQKEWTRHRNAGKVKVTVFLNEINNWRYAGLLQFISWARKFGIRVILYLQNFTAFDLQNGDKAIEVLISEAEAKLFLPSGLREPKVKEYLEQELGNAAWVIRNNSGKRKEFGLDSFGYSEESRPLLTRDEIRQLKDYGILLLADRKPIKSYLTSVAATYPFRKRQGLNPLYGKPYLKPVKLRLLRYARWWPANVIARVRQIIRKTPISFTKKRGQK